MPLEESIYTREDLTFTIKPNDILEILKNGPWETLNQEINSAETNNDKNTEPDFRKIEEGENTCGVDAFADLPLNKNVTRILDVGGGKYDCCHNYMKSKNIHLLVWDPYNRSQQHNTIIKNSVKSNKVDAATSMAVLNVISESRVRLAHIATLKDALIISGKAYFKVWPGEGKRKGTGVPTINSYGYPGYQANAYADYFLREVQLVFGVRNVKLHETIPNLIVATKESEHITSLEEIRLIQTLLKDEFHGRHTHSIFKKNALSLEKTSMFLESNLSESDFNINMR